VNEPVGDDLDAQATSTSRSSVSRRFKAATDAQLDELMSRDLSELDLAALMLDGVHFADACCVVALAVGADGTKCRSACGWATPRTRPPSPPCWPISSPGASTPTAGCWS
jgi:hypothetical protein